MFFIILCDDLGWIENMIASICRRSCSYVEPVVTLQVRFWHGFVEGAKKKSTIAFSAKNTYFKQ